MPRHKEAQGLCETFVTRLCPWCKVEQVLPTTDAQNYRMWYDFGQSTPGTHQQKQPRFEDMIHTSNNGYKPYRKNVSWYLPSKTLRTSVRLRSATFINGPQCKLPKAKTKLSIPERNWRQGMHGRFFLQNWETSKIRIDLKKSRAVNYFRSSRWSPRNGWRVPKRANRMFKSENHVRAPFKIENKTIEPVLEMTDGDFEQPPDELTFFT